MVAATGTGKTVVAALDYERLRAVGRCRPGPGSTMHETRTVATNRTSRPAFYVVVSRGERDVSANVTSDRAL